MKSQDVFKQSFEKHQTGFDLVLDFRSMTIEQKSKPKMVNGKMYDENAANGVFFVAQNAGAVSSFDMPNFTKEVNDYENEVTDVKRKYWDFASYKKDNPEVKRVDVYQDLADNQTIQFYYQPVTSWIQIRDQKTPARMTVFVDRAQGGVSRLAGQIELMIERKSKYDDGKGVKEATNDECDLKVSHRILFTKSSAEEDKVRRLQLEIEKPFLGAISLVSKESSPA